MKKLLLIISVALIAMPTIAAQKTKVKAQKVVVNEYGHTTVGILIPDRGMADPHVWIEDGTLYTFCGHDKSWEPRNEWVMDHWELWSTKNLTDWQHHLTIEPTETYIGDQPNCWAGDICERNGKYYWFFSNRNINTGVMVADKITGPYTDLLGEPLLPTDIIPGHPYDPEIYIENDEYYICFGAGQYYISILSEDMKSLKDKPQPISLVDKKGDKVFYGDKPTLFKRNDWYYLASGGKYAMSRNLYGPYTAQGTIGTGGHNSFFVWDGQWYMIHETGDTNIFYRGIGLQPIYFNEDGTLFLSKNRASHPGTGRNYNFTASQMGWHTESGTTLKWNKKGYIKGEISEAEASISSAVYLLNSLGKVNKTLQFTLTNNTPATKARIAIASHDDAKQFWKEYSPEVEWSEHSYIDIDITPNCKEAKTYEVDLSKISGLKEKLMQIRIYPAMGASGGKWKLDDIVLSK